MAYCAVCWTVEKRIGVGTESPSHPIHVYDGGNSVYSRWERSTGNMYIGSDSIGGALGATGNIPLYFWTGDGTERMRIACQGNVGIGSTDPLAKLHVEQSTTGEVARFRANVAGCADLVLVNNAQTWGLRVDNAVSNALHIRNFQNSTNIMTLATGGNVGIGTTSPTYNLVVGNDLGNLSTLSTTSVVGNTSANSFFVIGQSATRNLQFNWQYNATAGSACGQIVTYGYSNPISIDGSTLVLQSLSGGNVGINRTNPFAPLEVYKSCSGGLGGFIAVNNNGTAVGNETAFMFADGGSTTVRAAISSTTENAPYCGDLKFKTGVGTYDCLSTRMIIKGNGTVGINTASPSYRLHVNGTFYAAGSSIKYKEGICNYDTNSCLFMCLKPVTYQYKDEFKHLGKELKADTQIGLIAEDVAEVMPELAVLVNEEDEKVVRNVDYEKLSIVLLAEVQKLRKEMDQLKAQ